MIVDEFFNEQFAEAVADALYDGGDFDVGGEIPTEVDVIHEGKNTYVDVTFASEEVYRLSWTRVR